MIKTTNPYAQGFYDELYNLIRTYSPLITRKEFDEQMANMQYAVLLVSFKEEEK